MKRYAIVGAGGFGREVFDYVDSSLRSAGVFDVELIFAVEEGFNVREKKGRRIVNVESIIGGEVEIDGFYLAISDSYARERIAYALEQGASHARTVISEFSYVAKDAALGMGAIVAPYALISSGSTVGKQLHLNHHAYIAHDCTVGDYVTFAPGAKCNGSVIVNDHAYIGSGAVIKNSSPSNLIEIGRGAKIGMGAVVLESVAEGQVVVGNPAKPLPITRPASAG